MAADDKNKAIDLAISQIERQHGKGAIMRFSSEDILPVEVIPTGSLALDIALGVGGVPRGRIVEIFGHESSGKTTLALHIIAEAQRMGGAAAFVDVEHAIDPMYAKRIGVNMEHLLISQPDTGEQALEIVETLVRSSAIDVVVIDSVAALTPQAEIEGEMGDAHVGLLPRLMSKALRKLSGVASKSKSCIIFTNQIRQKIGSCLVIQKPHPAAWPSSSTPRSDWRFDGRKRSKKGPKWLATESELKLPKTKWHRLLHKLNLK